MRQIVSAGQAGLIVVVLGACLGTACLPAEAVDRPAPDFPTKDPERWLNSSPLSMSGLRGKVVLLDVWTYG